MSNDFDLDFAQSIFDGLLAKHKITVRKIRKQSCGCANIYRREIEVPKIVDVDTFGVCVHEVFHVVQGHVRPKYLEEFNCDKFALDLIKSLGWQTAHWYRRMQHYSLSYLAKT